MNDVLSLPYQEAVPNIQLGGILLNNQIVKDGAVHLVLQSFTRHGLIAGSTGSGKTKTMQVLAEQLALAGIPCLVMDIKGDISGLAMPSVGNDFLVDRAKTLDLTFEARAFSVEMLTLNHLMPGLPLRATVDFFGAVLFSRMLGLNETQTGVVTIIFEYAKEAQLPLVDLNDFRSVLHYAQTEAGKKAIESRFGGISSASVGTIVRKIIELEAQGGGDLFGEPAYNVQDLVRTNGSGEGIISILRLMDMQDKPKLFSTFMLKLLSDVYRSFPELGDVAKPKLVLFIDEAHLIFNNASKALLELLETMIKLIRSKGVGIFFCTQLPTDIPDAILSQLGLKIQHSLRAFTAKDRQAMKLVAQNFPPTEYYNTEQLLTSLGIGEALVTALDSKGRPTPLIQCLIRPPESRMGVLSDQEMRTLVNQSALYAHYKEPENKRSAAEMLTEEEPVSSPAIPKKPKQKTVEEVTVFTHLSKNTLVRQLVRQFFRQLTSQLIKLFKIK